MSDYTMAQIKSMQEEATRRVREMNERSKRTVQNANQARNTKPNPPPQQTPRSESPQKKEHKSPPSESAPKKGPLNFLNFFDIKKLIGDNSEQALLLLLILVLISDNTSDEYLIYALIYIML